MFLKDSMSCAYERFPSLKNLMVCINPYSVKPLEEIDRYPCFSDCMKKCDSCKNFDDHVSSFECFATTTTITEKLNQKISLMHHTKYLFSILHKMW